MSCVPAVTSAGITLIPLACQNLGQSTVSPSEKPHRTSRTADADLPASRPRAFQPFWLM